MLEELARLRPAGLDLAHVGDVEHPGAVANRQVLLADPAAYWIGISQPANGTSLALAARCRS